MRINKIADLVFTVLPKLQNKDIYFIFPFYHLGGAETVHLDIMKVFRERKCVCLITNESANELNKSAFTATAQTLDLSHIIKRKKEKRVALKLISFVINRAKSPVVFGCNSHFFYDLIPYLRSDIKIIDLIHAFSYEEPYAAEKYSILHVHRIDKRVVLGDKTLSDFHALYGKNDISYDELQKITIIKNQVSVPAGPQYKNPGAGLKILYVGRDGYEKRPQLFFDIARQCYEQHIPSSFFVIGFSTAREVTPNVTIVGELAKVELDQHYHDADLLLITSSREGFPMVVLEGMTYGVVPVCTDVGEIPSFINAANANGFLISNAQPVDQIVSDFVDVIRSLHENRLLLAETSKKAYESVKRTFDQDAFSKNYINLVDN